VFINPEIIEQSGSQLHEEGCLSVPGIFAEIGRAEKIKINYLNRNGKPITEEADEMLAVCLQHEIDHLDGKVFVDRLSRLKQERIKKRLLKEAKQSANNA
jgi:peptide deformylase